MVSTWTVMPWAVGIDTAKGLGGLSLHSSFPAWGPLPRSRLLNRQVVQLAIIFFSLDMRDIFRSFLAFVQTAIACDIYCQTQLNPKVE
jgi:hypothetical protein